MNDVNWFIMMDTGACDVCFQVIDHELLNDPHPLFVDYAFLKLHYI